MPGDSLPFTFIINLLILTRYLRRVFNSYGVPISPSDRNNQQFRFQCTQLDHRVYAKVTISAATDDNLKRGYLQLMKLLNNCPVKGRVRENHCSICFRFSHSEKDCTFCAACLEGDHQIAACPWLKKEKPEQPRVNLIISNPKRHDYRQKDRVNHPIFWKNIGNIDFKVLDKLTPIGPENNLKKTLAVDTEGLSSDGKAHLVVLAAWFTSASLGAQVIYSDFVKHTDINYLTTPISSVQAQQIKNGNPLEEIKKNILLACADKRVLIFDSHDKELQKIGITSTDLKEWKIEVVNVQHLFGGSALHKLVRFYFPSSQGLKRDSDNPMNGHNPALDACFTIKLYRKYLSFVKENEQIPAPDEVSSFVKKNKNFEEWKEEAKFRQLLNQPCSSSSSWSSQDQLEASSSKSSRFSNKQGPVNRSANKKRKTKPSFKLPPMKAPTEGDWNAPLPFTGTAHK